MIRDLVRMSAFWIAHHKCTGFRDSHYEGMYMIWCPAHNKGETVWRPAMAKHGKNPRGWITVLGLIGASLALGSLIALVVINPGKHAPQVACDYTAMKVTVSVIGPDCRKVILQVVDDADFPWKLVKKPRGEQFARLSKGNDTIAIYEAGDKPLAGALANHFQAAQWKPEVASP